MKRLHFVVLVVFIGMFLGACQQVNDNNATSLHINGTEFIDQHGRQVLLNGVNLVNKKPEEGYIGPEKEDAFKNFRKWGFNVIRLGVIWDGLEPQPGVFNEAYLQKIDEQIQWAKDNNLFVFLDMHQDLFSVKFSDGAPEWATLDEGEEHITGAVWSDSYLISPAVQKSWDNFWANKQVDGGMGVQDHYAKAVQHLAKRYSDNSTVIGFDIMNEPFAGSDAKMFMPVLFTAYAQVVSEKTNTEVSALEVAQMWENTGNRYEALQLVNDKESFAKVMDAVYELNSSFEKGALQSFYQKVANAVREVTSDKMLFFNHSYFCNSGVYTALKPFTLSNGEVDKNVVYAAHGYDLLVDTDNLSDSSDERLELIFGRINESGKRMNVPVLIGEWGALGHETPGRVELAHRNLRLFEKYLFNNTYWAYHEGTEKYSYFKYGVIRPFPSEIAGKLLSYDYDPQKSVFSCKWMEKAEIKAPTRIFIPVFENVSFNSLELMPKSDAYKFVKNDNGIGGYLEIQPQGTAQERSLKITIKPNRELEMN
ncbi:cellulase family glycosylhydrolase [Carboxylicivirga sediminis]|uniref:Cellulase family glycosylhydrolase n=1 Tax=Carboxylicivirga sediminis TaxID=2006564 RepID=A0A941IXA9_9BACT|nr:cellulase family glycosylhydrolase [Carboxylicivirga sediminis]MBR8535875.1 cellulase family glycosylhydrolase [Carboxylicivirga sediminis]